MKSKKIFVLLSALALSLAACSSKGNNPSTSQGGADSTSQGGDSQSSQGGNSTSDQGGEVAVTSVTLDQATLALEVGKSANLTATVLPANASNTKVSWSSSDATIASVSNLGKVTAVKVGTATITATSQSNPQIKAECVVTVSEEGGKYGSVNKPKTVAQILAIAAEECKEANDRTAEPVYVKGIVWKAPTNKGTFSQGIYLKDALTDQKDLWVYSANHDELKEPYKNDEVVLHGYLMNYNGTIEVSNVTIDGAKVYPAVDSVTRGTSSITYNVEHGSVNAEAPKSGKNMSEFSFTVTPEANYKVDTVSINGTEVTAQADGSYKGVIKGDMTVAIEISEVGVENLRAVMKYTPAEGSASGNMTGGNDAALLGLDPTLFSAVSGMETGIYAGLNAAGNIRLYNNRNSETDKTDGTHITVSSARATIKKIDITLASTSVAGALLQVKAGDTVVTGENLSYEINASSFTLKNVTDGADSKQIHIDQVAITYEMKAEVHATGIAVAPTSLEIEVGNNGQLAATLTPENATDVVVWSSSADAIATVDQTGKVTAVAVGTATITAKVSDEIKATAAITVKAAKVINYGTAEAPLTVAEAKAVLDETGTSESKQPLFVKGIVSQNTALSSYGNFDEVWLQNADGSVAKEFELYRVKFDASVTDAPTTENGLAGYEVVAKGYGKIYRDTYELTTSSNEPKNPLIIAATAPAAVPATGISLDKETATLYPEQTLQLKATLAPAGAVDPITWTSSDPAVATVSDSGLVTAVAAGTAKITAKVSDSIKAECTVTVEAPVNTPEFDADLTTEMNVNNGFTITSSSKVSKKTGYYQDGGTADSEINYFMVKKAAPIFASQPSSIKLTAKLGAGSAKDPLDHNVEACFVDASGDEIAATKVTVATALPKDPADFTVDLPYNANACGVKLMHMKENSWNARYYSFSLRVTAGETPVEQPVGQFHGLAKTAAGTFIPVDMVLAADSVALDINGAAATVTSYNWDNKDTLSIVTDGAYGTITATFAENVFTITGLTGAAAAQLDLTYAVQLSGNCQFIDCSVMTLDQMNATFVRRYDRNDGNGWQINNPSDGRISVATKEGRTGLQCNGFSTGKVGFTLKNDLPTPIPGTVIKSVGCWIYNPGESSFTMKLFAYKGANRTNNGQLNTFTIEPGWHFYQSGVVNGSSFTSSDSFYNFQFYYENVSVHPVFDDLCIYM